MCDNAERNQQLVGYVYDELDVEERKAFEAHLANCGACRVEVAGLGTTRERMAAWGPPDADVAGTGLRLVRAAEAPAAPVQARLRLPAWGLAAAAALVLAASAALANLEVRVGSDGLVVRTGWAQAAAPSETAPQVATVASTEDAESWNAIVAQLQARLDELEGELAARGMEPGIRAAATPGGPSDADVWRRVREIVAQSERRQQGEVRALMSQMVRELEGQRRSDIALIQQGMGQYHGLTNAEIAQQRDVINQLVRVASRQER
ncbi:MAG: zf-HC2 domain-containing protein [Acidobacteria bacterium]|nr:zf-HC2 domain-containing protein [Acidobacteriota bacterium]MBA3886084.1 zf-HC2 domain-containing protein [Acidobacteriota bacterium]